MATLPLQLRRPQQSRGEPCIAPGLGFPVGTAQSGPPGAAPPEQPLVPGTAGQGSAGGAAPERSRGGRSFLLQ